MHWNRHFCLQCSHEAISSANPSASPLETVMRLPTGDARMYDCISRDSMLSTSNFQRCGHSVFDHLPRHVLLLTDMHRVSRMQLWGCLPFKSRTRGFDSRIITAVTEYQRECIFNGCIHPLRRADLPPLLSFAYFLLFCIWTRASFRSGGNCSWLNSSAVIWKTDMKSSCLK